MRGGDLFDWLAERELNENKELVSEEHARHMFVQVLCEDTHIHVYIYIYIYIHIYICVYVLVNQVLVCVLVCYMMV